MLLIGIYRVPADMEKLKTLRSQVNDGNLDILDETKDIHILAGALKLFFRELTRPLMPWSEMEKLAKASKNKNVDEKVKELKKCLDNLPKVRS